MNLPAPSRYPWVLGLLRILAAALGGLALRLGSAALEQALQRHLAVGLPRLHDARGHRAGAAARAGAAVGATLVMGRWWYRYAAC